MSRVKELRIELKKLNGLQWAKKRQLKEAIRRDSRKSISRLSKDMNSRRRDINIKESELIQIKMSRSKNAFFQHTEGSILGVHSVGFQDGDQYIEEEIWTNSYRRNEQGELFMVGGSMRTQGPFESVVEEYLKDPEFKRVNERQEN